MFKKLISSLLVGTMLMTGVCGCSDNSGEADGGLSIVCTVFPGYDWCREILGDHVKDVNLTYLLGDGSSMHDYQPDDNDIRKIAKCDVFVYTGGESEKWADEILGGAVNQSMKIINMIELLGDDTIELEEEETNTKKLGKKSEEDENGEKTTEPEPEPDIDEHVWLSIRNAELFCTSITDAICEKDPSNAEDYRSNFESYNSKLTAIDKEYKLLFNDCKKHALIFGDRNAFRYFEKDYNILCYAAIDKCLHKTEATYSDVIALAKQVDYFKTHYVYVLENTDTTIADTIIEHVETKNQHVKVLNSMHFVSKKEADKGASYLSYMLENYDVMEEALN